MNQAAHLEIQDQLGPTLQNQLGELMTSNSTATGTIQKVVGRTELRARVKSVGRLACEVESIHTVHPQSTLQSATQMRALAGELAKQLSYLEERLVVLEVDRLAPEVQLRSESPRAQGNSRCYFEVRVGKGGIALQRFSKAVGQPRKIVPATLTRDMFVRVCADLVSVLESTSS